MAVGHREACRLREEKRGRLMHDSASVDSLSTPALWRAEIVVLW